MGFKNTDEMLPEIANFLKKIQKLPKVSCAKCGAVYRGEEEKFIS